MLLEAGLLQDRRHTSWNMAKGSILYVGGKKPGPCPKGWRGKVLRVLHCKAGGATYGAHNGMLSIQREEEWKPIELNTWTSKTISGCLEARVEGKQVQIVTLAPIRYKVF